MKCFGNLIISFIICNIFCNTKKIFLLIQKCKYNRMNHTKISMRVMSFLIDSNLQSMIGLHSHYHSYQQLQLPAPHYFIPLSKTQSSLSSLFTNLNALSDFLFLKLFSILKKITIIRKYILFLLFLKT